MLGNDFVELFYDLSVSWQFNKNSAFPRPWRNDVKMVHERGTCWKCYRLSSHLVKILERWVGLNSDTMLEGLLVPDALANADWLVYLAWATPAEIMLGIFLGINDYFHCQDIFHQVQLPPVRNYGQGKVIWSVVNVYVWTWEFMFCGPAKLIKLQN